MGEPLLLAGPPDDLRATIELENTTDQRMTLRGMVLRRKGEDDQSGRFAAILPPSSTTSVPLRLALSPTTAPGDYPAHLEIGGQSREATLRVEEKIAARITPDHVLAEPGRTTVRLRAVNQGNVAIPLARTTQADVHEDDVSERRDDDVPSVTLKLKTSTVLDPGATLDLRGTLSVPDGLDPARRHEALVPVGVCDLLVTVLPLDPAPPVPPRKRTRPARTQRTEE